MERLRDGLAGESGRGQDQGAEREDARQEDRGLHRRSHGCSSLSYDGWSGNRSEPSSRLALTEEGVELAFGSSLGGEQEDDGSAADVQHDDPNTRPWLSW